MSVTTIFVTSSQKQNNSVHQLWWKWNNNPSGQTACRLEPGQDDASEWKLFSLIGTDNCIRPEYPAHLWLQCSEHWIKNIQWLQCLVWLKGRTNASWLSGTILKHFLGSILHYLWMEQQCDVIADWRLGRTKRCNTQSCHLLWCSKSSNHNNSAHSWIRLRTKQLGTTKVLVTGCF